MTAPQPARSAAPYFNPNMERGPDQLSEDLKNLQMDAPPRQPSPVYFRSSVPPSMGMQASRPGPPQGAFARGPMSMPHSVPSQAMGRPSMTLPSNQPSMPPGAMVHPQASFSSRPFAMGRPGPPYRSASPSHGMNPSTPLPSDFGAPSRPVTQNGPSVFTSRAIPGPPTVFSSTGAQQQQVGQPPIMAVWPPGQPSSPFSPTSTPFSSLHQSAPTQPVSPYRAQEWQVDSPRRGVPPTAPGFTQPTRAFGYPPLSQNHFSGHPEDQGFTRIDDHEQIPRPVPFPQVISFETRYGNQANIPPPASCDFIVKDTGNCSPRFIRCTLYQIPCTADMLTTSGMQLGLLVQPLAIPHPDEEPIQVVDFGESGPVRCSRCKGYINPFMKFIDQGKRFICNLCGFTDETPRDYQCNLGPNGKRRDADERPELCRGTVDFVATKEFMVRDPMPTVFFFLIDVSMNAVQTGATAAACSAISQVICEVPEGLRTFVGIATFDSTIHFYDLNRASQQPLMLVVPDVHDVFTPLQTDVIVPVSECRQHLELLLDIIPTKFKDNRSIGSAFGAAIKAAFLAMKSTGGKLLVFQSVLPSVGFGSLSSREAEGKVNLSGGEKAHKLLQAADKTLKTMAIELAEYQVCVDIFITSQTYVDIASISVIPRTTGGQVYYYHPFSALADNAKLYNDLRWNITRPQGMEAVMRVRCSQGLQVQEYYGNFCKRLPTDVDLPGIDCDKTIMVMLKHEDKLLDGSECSFQCALLYTTVNGERRIRVSTLSIPCTSVLNNLFRAADLDSQFGILLKQAANEIPFSVPSQVREQVTKHCINIFLAYRSFCAAISSSGQLVMPEALKLLPLYALALIKSIGLRTDYRVEDRSFWISYVSSLPASLMVPFVHPRMFSIHDLKSEGVDGSIIPPLIPLTSEILSDKGVYFLENGIDGLVYVSNAVDPNILMQLFGVSSKEEIPVQFVLEQFDNPLSKALNDVVNEIRRQRCSYLRLKLCKKGEQSGFLFLSYMVEDKAPMGVSYMEFLVYMHRTIQGKLA